MTEQSQTNDDGLMDEVTAQSNATAVAIFKRLVEEVSSLDQDGLGTRIIYYSLWVSLTQCLALLGWNSEELCKDMEFCMDVVHCANVAILKGNVQ